MHSEEIKIAGYRRATRSFARFVCECVHPFGSISPLNRIISIISNNIFSVDRRQSFSHAHAHTHCNEMGVTHGQK